MIKITLKTYEIANKNRVKNNQNCASDNSFIIMIIHYHHADPGIKHGYRTSGFSGQYYP